MNASEMYKWTNLPDSICRAHYLLCDVWEEHSSPQTKGSFNSPLFIILIIAVYNVVVLAILPAIMANRTPLALGGLMKWYNYINIGVNVFLFVVGVYNTRCTYDCWLCQDFRQDVSLSLATFCAFLYTALKIFDLLDTVFFVLRKKSNQVTPLHLIHHSIMPFTSYLGIKLAYGPSAGLTLIINSFVHIVMYYYYHLSSQGHQIWWKKHITHLQLVQFVIVWLHAFHTFFIANCSFPRWAALLQILQSTYFIISFSKFYLKAYKKTCNNPDSNNNDSKKLVMKKEK